MQVCLNEHKKIVLLNPTSKHGDEITVNHSRQLIGRLPYLGFVNDYHVFAFHSWIIVVKDGTNAEFKEMSFNEFNNK